MRRFIVAVSLSALIFLSITPRSAVALQLPDGRTKSCVLPSGVQVPELVAPGPPVGFAGQTGPINVPPFVGISYNTTRLNAIANQAGLLAANMGVPPQFIARNVSLVVEQLAYHECAHARVPTSNEIVANCESIRQMITLGEASPADVQWIYAFTSSLGPQPPQYGGSGQAFATLTAQCVAQHFNVPVTSLDSVPI